MKKQVKEVDKKRGIFQVTTYDERWYAKPVEDPKTKLPTYVYVPSVTWIASYYPKGIGYMKWLAEKGWDEAEAIKVAAGDKGSKVHKAIERLIAGQTVKMDEKIVNASTGQEEELTVEEYEAVMAFVTWHTKLTKEGHKIEFVASETAVWGDGYAGTVDFLVKIDGVLWLVDVKTSQYVWPSSRIQVSAYKHTKPEWKDVKLAILQVGYKRNKDRFKWNPVEDQFHLFQATKLIWAEETSGQAPQQRDYPVKLALSLPEKPKDKPAKAKPAPEPPVNPGPAQKPGPAMQSPF